MEEHTREEEHPRSNRPHKKPRIDEDENESNFLTSLPLLVLSLLFELLLGILP